MPLGMQNTTDTVIDEGPEKLPKIKSLSVVETIALFA